ncbi:MAG: F0F1 ATP synthase subunit B [Pirellulaceae bacterium]|nr:F0F1 ATP synthase subunit B [Pirellulaceae bacterium]
MHDRMWLHLVVWSLALLGPLSGGQAYAADNAEVTSEQDVSAGEQAGTGTHDADGHASDGHASDGHADHGHSGDSHGAAADHGEVPSPISVDPDLAIVTAVIFFGLLAVLWKFAWNPIIAAIDAREGKMASDLAAAAKANEESKRLLAAHEAKLAEAAAEVRQLLDGARKDADVHREKILAEAQAAAQSEKDRAIREIESAKNAALQDVAEKSVDTAVALAGKIVKRQLSAQDHSQLIGEALEKFPSKN